MSTRAACALMLAGAVVHFGPEHLAAAGLGSLGALEYVAYGVEATVAWLLVALAWRRSAVALVALWLAVESAARAGCRLALPMDRPPAGAGTLCERATGSDLTAWLGIVALAALAGYIAREGHHDANA